MREAAAALGTAMGLAAGAASTAAACLSCYQVVQHARGQWQLLRHWLMEQLVAGRQWRQACWLVSTRS